MRALHWPVVPWAGRWGQVAEEEAHLCRVAALGQHRHCLGTVEEGSIAVEYSVLRVLLCQRRVWCSMGGCGGSDTRHRPFPLLVAHDSQRKGGKGRTYSLAVVRSP